MLPMHPASPGLRFEPSTPLVDSLVRLFTFRAELHSHRHSNRYGSRIVTARSRAEELSRTGRRLFREHGYAICALIGPYYERFGGVYAARASGVNDFARYLLRVRFACVLVQRCSIDCCIWSRYLPPRLYPFSYCAPLRKFVSGNPSSFSSGYFA
jgi:hypothetical protein